MKTSVTNTTKRALRNDPTIRKYLLLFIGVTTALLISSIFFSSCTQETKANETIQPLTQIEMIQRGKYLVTIAGCHDCHSPKVMTPEGPVPDTTRLLSGHPENEPVAPVPATKDWILFSPGLTSAVGPWGISFAANLTPDDTGTGSWSFEQFRTAIRKGKYKGLEGSRNLLPPMPWQMIRNLTDDDLRSIFAYLQSIKPISNQVPAPIAPEDMNAIKK